MLFIFLFFLNFFLYLYLLVYWYIKIMNAEILPQETDIRTRVGKKRTRVGITESFLKIYFYYKMYNRNVIKMIFWCVFLSVS